MTWVHTGNAPPGGSVVQDVTESIRNLSLVEHLRVLHDDYVDAVNRAVAEDRDDLVEDLADEYTDAATALMARVLPAAA